MKNIEIKEYTPQYAERIADMWINSKNGWNGEILHATKESVLAYEENSSYLKLFLALEGDKVVGYCKLSDNNGENALFIPYLNVRDDYHGKKIGKFLVKKCVEETTKLGYSRLDLYTWPGNMKAVPLYKKCGFHWQNNGSTHLYNFVPMILKSELIKGCFKDLDWYDDNKRKIEVKPDGIEENKFEYFRYKWENQDNLLEVDISLYGKGIRRIKTKDYEITMTLENLDLVFDNNYNVKFEIHNYSSRLIDFKLSGHNLDYSKLQLNETIEMQGGNSCVIDSNVYIKSIKNEFKKEEILPTIGCDVEIEGKKQKFEIGCLPKFPVLTSIKFNKKILKTFCNEKMFLEFENRINKDINLKFKMPEKLGLENSYIDIELKSNEKKSIPYNIFLKNAISLNNNIEFEVFDKENKLQSFHQNINKVFPTYDDSVYGENDDDYVLSNGSTYMEVNKYGFDKNFIEIYDISFDNIFWTGYPLFGNPISEKYEQKQARDISFERKSNNLLMTRKFHFDQYPKVELIQIVQMLPTNTIKQFWKVKNNSDNEYFDIKLIEFFGFYSFEKMIIPYNNKYIEINSESGGRIDNFNGEKFHENWMFKYSNGVGIGISWDESQKIDIEEWRSLISYKIPHLKSGQTIEINSLNIFVNKFNDWNKFRNFICNDIKNLYLTKYSEIESKVDENSKKSIMIKNDKEIKNLITLNKTNTKKINKIHKENDNVYTIDNGIIIFSTSKDFAPVIHSLKYNNMEWLHTSFPKLGPKSWDNPWSGGLSIKLNNMRLSKILQEKYFIEFCKKVDNKGEKWEGILITINIEKFEKLKGFIFKQYFLTKPNSPYLISCFEITNKSGKLANVFAYNKLHTCFFSKTNLGEVYYNDYVAIPGQESKEFSSSNNLYITKNENSFIHFKSLKTNFVNSFMHMDKEYLFQRFIRKNIVLENKDSYFQPISVIFFGDKQYNESNLNSFNSIEFK